MSYSFLIFLVGIVSCGVGFWLSKSVRKTQLDEGSARILIRYINEAVVSVAKPGAKQVLLVLLFFVVALIAFKLSVNEFHTGLIPLCLILGVGTAHLNARVFIKSSTSTLESAVQACQTDVASMPRTLMRGVLAMGLFMTGSVLMLLSFFFVLISHFFTVDAIPFIAKVSPMIRNDHWEMLTQSHEVLSHFLSLELVLSLLALCLGMTIYALVVRLKSGLVAKTSDIAADSVGRAEFELLEDDLRNPGVIADLAGDQLGNTLGNALLLLECTLFLVAMSAITAVMSYPEPYVLHHHAFTVFHTIFQPLGILFCGAIASFLTVLLWKLHVLKFRYLSSLLYPAYMMMPFVVFAFGALGWLPEHSTLLALFSSFLGLLIVAHVQWLLNLKGRVVTHLKESLEVNSLTGIFHGLMLGVFAAAVPLLGLGVVFFAVLKVHAGFAMPMMFHRLGIAGVALLSPTLLLAALGAFSSLADNVKGCSEMIMMPKEILRKTHDTDQDSEAASAIAKVILILSGTVSIFFLPYLFLIRINHAMHHYALAANYTSLIDYFHIHIQNPVFLMGTVFGILGVLVWIGLLLKAVTQGVERGAQFIRHEFNIKEGLWSGSTLPDYHLFVQIVEANATKWTWILIGSVLAFALSTVLILGVSGAMGVLIGAVSSACGLALLFLFSGSLWKQSKKTFEAADDFKSSAYFSSLFTDGVGDVFKDVLSPSLMILVKMFCVIMIIFGSMALWM